MLSGSREPSYCSEAVMLKDLRNNCNHLNYSSALILLTLPTAIRLKSQTHPKAHKNPQSWTSPTSPTSGLTPSCSSSFFLFQKQADTLCTPGSFLCLAASYDLSFNVCLFHFRYFPTIPPPLTLKHKL